MEKLIVDVGVAVKWFVTEADSAKANLIYDDFQFGSLELLAPELIYAEFGNVIWKKQNFQGLADADADFALTRFKAVKFQITPTTNLFDDAYKIAVKYKRSFYDSLYLALSERENCRFVTADERLYNSVNADLPNTVWLANWT